MLKVWQARGKVARKPGKKQTDLNQQAKASNMQPYCWFGKGNIREEKVRSDIRS